MVLTAEDKAEVGGLVATAVEAATAKIVETATAKAGEAVTAALGPVNKALADTAASVKALADADSKPGRSRPGSTPSPATGLGAGDDAPVTMAALAALLKERDDKAAVQQADAAKRARRDAWAAEKCKDLPTVYRDQLPVTDDAKALEAAEQDLRKRFRADLEAAGIKAPNLGAIPTGPGPGAAAVDVSKLSGTQKIAAGLAAK